MFLFTIFIINISHAQKDSQSEIIFFNDFIESVINKLPDIQLNKLKSIDAEVQILKAQKQKEWAFNIRGGAFQESDFTGNIDSPFVFQTGWDLSTSIDKTFINIGGRMNLDFTFRNFLARGVVDGITEEREFFVPVFTLKYAQPLLKNAFGILDRLPIVLASLDKKINDWTYEEENSYLLSTYKKIYMQWVVYDQIRDFLYESLENAQDLEKISREQKNIGYTDEVDYQNAKMLSLEIKNELLDVETTYTNLLFQISYLMDNTNIKPHTEEWQIFSEAINNESFQGIPFTETRQALILDFVKEKITHSTRGLKNSRLPELNLLLTAAMEVYSTNSTSQINEMIIVPAYYAGVQMRYPFDNMDYKINSRTLHRQKAEYNILVNKYKCEFDYKLKEKERNLLFYRNKIDNRYSVRQALDIRYQSQRKKFSQGREVLANLIETRNKLLKNRIEEADVQLRLIFEYFDYLVMINKDEISLNIH